MSTAKRETSSTRREAWGRLRKLPSGRWQVRYPGPDGRTYTARTEADKPLTFLTKTDARTWLANVHTQIVRGQWEPPAVVAARRRAESEEEKARTLGFAEYAERWMEMIRSQPNRSGKNDPKERSGPTRARSADTSSRSSKTHRCGTLTQHASK